MTTTFHRHWRDVPESTCMCGADAVNYIVDATRIVSPSTLFAASRICTLTT